MRLKTHQTISKVTDDYARRQTFNTAIAACMELLNTISSFAKDKQTEVDRRVLQEALEAVILMLAPIVPHFSHVVWQQLGHEGTAMDATWPKVDKTALKQDSMLIVLQVNGKLRGRMEVDAGLDKAALEAAALSNEAVQKYTETGTVRKVIVVPGRLVNIVIS